MTLLDFVVHVPVNCGSVCADIRDISNAPAASDARNDTTMKYGRWNLSRVLMLCSKLKKVREEVWRLDC